VIAFLDGDRAGDLILKELQGMVNVDKVLRAPMGREVEECTPLEIAEILRDVVVVGQHPSSGQQLERKPINRQVSQEYDDVQSDRQQSKDLPPESREDNDDILSIVREVYPQINETLEAVVLDGSMRTLLKVPVSDVVKKLDNTEGAKMLVLDGIITQRLVEAADKAGIEYVVGHRMGDLKKSTDVRVRTFVAMGINN